jgi:hypothetical protein
VGPAHPSLAYAQPDPEPKSSLPLDTDHTIREVESLSNNTKQDQEWHLAGCVYINLPGGPQPGHGRMVGL